MRSDKLDTADYSYMILNYIQELYRYFRLKVEENSQQQIIYFFIHYTNSKQVKRLITGNQPFLVNGIKKWRN